MTTPAEDHAAREGLPVIPFTNFDLGRILTGHPMIVRDLAGNEVLVRLFTADELLAAAERAAASLEAQGIPRGPGMDRAKAIELMTPLR